MPIEVEDVGEEEATEVGEDTTESPEPVSNSPVSEAVPERPKTSAKSRGRPPGSRNKPKPLPEPVTEEVIEEVIVKKKKTPKKVVYISESEEEPTPPPSPGTQRKNEWAAYRQKQVNAHQARSAHYTKALDKMLAF